MILQLKNYKMYNYIGIMGIFIQYNIQLSENKPYILCTVGNIRYISVNTIQVQYYSIYYIITMTGTKIIIINVRKTFFEDKKTNSLQFQINKTITSYCYFYFKFLHWLI